MTAPTKEVKTTDKPKRTRKVAKSPQEIQKLIAAKKAELEKLELKANASTLEAACKKVGIEAAVKKIRDEVKDASDVAILTMIAKAGGLKRISITQEAIKPRAPRKPKATK